MNSIGSTIIAISILAGVNGLASGQVTVCMSFAQDAPAVERAQFMASNMFAGAGVGLKWRSASRECRTAVPAAIVVNLVEKQPKDVGRLSLARAYVYEGVHIEIFTPQVSGDDGIDPVLLSHVMVHEIAHILEGVARHSDTGIMKAVWTHTDCAQMQIKPLAFAADDIELIHAWLMRREAALSGSLRKPGN